MKLFNTTNATKSSQARSIVFDKFAVQIVLTFLLANTLQYLHPLMFQPYQSLHFILLYLRQRLVLRFHRRQSRPQPPLHFPQAAPFLHVMLEIIHPIAHFLAGIIALNLLAKVVQFGDIKITTTWLWLTSQIGCSMQSRGALC